MSEEQKVEGAERTTAEPRPADEGEQPAVSMEAMEAAEPPPTAEEVRLALRKVKDPELNLNIVDLGLVYDVVVEGHTVRVDMSLTSPACPSGPQLMSETERAAAAVPGVREAQVNLVWSPLWTPDRIEPRVRAYMGL
ncbi:MAG TPA: metal-sulfur cluster assembly factor [Gemmatimonadaceae bacterium]|nr:metal-sulfur cluster assembly factor [Gemmatimonadaceae bacterium]